MYLEIDSSLYTQKYILFFFSEYIVLSINFKYIYIFLLTIERIFRSRRKISRGADSKRQITRVTAMSRPADISTGNLRCCYCADTGQPFFSLSFPERVGRRNMERSGNKSRIYNWITRLSRWRPSLDLPNYLLYAFSKDKERSSWRYTRHLVYIYICQTSPSKIFLFQSNFFEYFIVL